MSNNTLKIFIGAPKDIDEERNIISRVVNDINITTRNMTEISLEVIGLDTDIRSKITGKDEPQAIINEIFDKCNIFIGILWKHFGTPTKKYESGTEEEFRKALEKYENNPESIDIMFYFCNKPPEQLSEISPKQLELINNFKTDIEDKGLYFTYSELDEFEEIIKKDLSLLISEKTNKHKQLKDIESNKYDEKISEESEGILDLFEIFNENIEAGANDLNKYTSEVEVFGENMTLGADFNPNDLNSVKKYVDSISDHMDNFSETTDYYSSKTKNHFFKALDSLINLSENYKSNIFENDEQIEQTKKALEEFDSVIKEAVETIEEGLVKNIDDVPPITTKFNKSKNKLLKSIKNLIKDFNNIRKMNNDAYKTLNSLES